MNAAACAAWLFFCVALPSAGEPGYVERILLFALLVAIPNALALVREAREPRVLALARLVAPFAAACAGVSFFYRTGALAALLCAPWLAVTALLALAGIARIARRKSMRAHEACRDAALLYVSIGAGWLVASRAGMHPLGFGEPLVILTGVHFHYAGFLAPVFASLAGERLGASRAFRVAAIGIVVGPPLLAAGITFSPRLEVATALALAGALAVFAAIQILHVRRLAGRPVARGALVLASLSLLAAMALACAYALRRIDLLTMITTHGWLNGLGFAGLSSLAWTIERRA